MHAAFRLHSAKAMEDANPDQLSKFEVTPSGLSMRFPRIDAEL